MKRLSIKSIKRTGLEHQVYDVTVQGNHNFFVGTDEILTHNCDYMSNSAQAVLRKLMEDCYETTRFIIIGNYEHKIIEAIRSRCTFKWRFSHPSERSVLTRIESILKQEQVKYTTDDLISIIADTYPDIRSCIGRLQQLTNNGVLSPSALLHHDRLTNLVDGILTSIESRNWQKARELLYGGISTTSEYIELYRAIYTNIHTVAQFANQSQQEEAILIIAEQLDSAIKSPGIEEIPTTAMFIRLCQVK